MSFITQLKRLYFKLRRKNPATMPMVSYWKFKEAVQAKIVKDKDGNQIMILEGEKYPIQGFPRSHILFGKLSPLKHHIKNQIFNDSWWSLERGEPKEDVIRNIKAKLFGDIQKYADDLKYDMMPPEAMCPSVREIHRAWTKVSPETGKLRDYLCLILQEDDGYRFRVQWLVKWFGWFFKMNPSKHISYALGMLEHAEVVSDMKERARLLRRIILLVLEDKKIKQLFDRLCKEIDWNKVKLTAADKYHFRGKYFRVDLDILEY
jgi:hypothetical protein